MAVIRKYAGAFSGPYVSTLPIYAPLYLPSLGVDTYSYRWRSSFLSGADGSAVTSWSSTSDDAVLASSGSAPVVSRIGTLPVATFDGAANKLSLASMPAYKSLVVVFKLLDNATTAGGILSSTDSDFSFFGDNANGLTTSCTGSGTTTVTAVDRTKWHVAVMVNDPITEKLKLEVDGVVGGGAGPTPADIAITSLVLGYTAAGGNGNVQIAEVATYAQALTSAQRASVRAAVKAATDYSVLALP